MAKQMADLPFSHPTSDIQHSTARVRGPLNFHDLTSNIEHRPYNKGLTLLELLITLTIMAFLGVIALEAFRLGSRSWEKGEGRAEREQRIRVIYGTLAQELASLQPVTAVVNGKPVLAFQGKSDRILFYSGPDGQRAFPYSAMVRSLAYFVEPGKG
ncbi:MAG: prepilin-type N-terminal cleavage/methylation domain-containing protein, partial [Candidatus Methylomirabilales bacterium]